MFVGQATQVLVPGYMYLSAGHTHALSDVEPTGDVVPVGHAIDTPPSQYEFGAHLQSAFVVAPTPTAETKPEPQSTSEEPGAAKALKLLLAHCNALVDPGIALKEFGQVVHVPGADK